MKFHFLQNIVGKKILKRKLLFLGNRKYPSFPKPLIFLTVFNFVIHQGKPPDWQDFVGIITLLLINSTISFIEENNAGNAAAALMARLAPKAKVF